MRTAVLATIAGALLLGSAHAEWKAEYGAADEATRDWYRTRQTTPETRARLMATAVAQGIGSLHYNYCCDHADTVKVKFNVNKTDHGDEWSYQLPNGSWKLVPPDVVQSGPTPDGKPVLFVDAHWSLGEVCLFTGEGGV